MGRHTREERRDIAARNLANQRELFAFLKASREAADKTLESAAAELKIAPTELEEIEAGHVDLTLGEIRELAYASEAVVRYSLDGDALESSEVLNDMFRQIDTFRDSRDQYLAEPGTHTQSILIGQLSESKQ